MSKDNCSEITGLSKAPIGSLAGSSKGMSAPGGFKKVDVLAVRNSQSVMTKTPVSKSNDDYELQSYIWLEGDEIAGESHARLKPEADLLLRVKDLSILSYYGLRFLIWIFALDQPVGKSRRGLAMIWLTVQYVKLVLEWRKLKGAWWV